MERFLKRKLPPASDSNDPGADGETSRRGVLELALCCKWANGGEQWRQQGYVHGGNGSVDLASHGHCAGVFIGV
jgi:hypothetical protein